MSKHLRPIIVLAILFAGLSLSAQQPGIIPQPVSLHWEPGNFKLDKNTVLIAERSESRSASFFNDYLEQIYGFRLRVRPAKDQTFPRKTGM